MKKISILFIGIFFLLQGLNAQPWINELYSNKLKSAKDIDFLDIQDAANKYFENRDKGKGTGYKQFKRWEWFMQQRVDENGNFDPTKAWIEFEKYKKTHPNYFLKSTGKNTTNNTTGNWTSLGPTDWDNGKSGYSPGNGRVNCIIEDPKNSNIIYLGTPSGGLWKTTDGGQTWLPKTDDLPVIGVSSIAIDPNNTNIVYMQTGDRDGSNTYGIGTMKSTDAGETWNRIGENSDDAGKIIINPKNTDIILVTTRENGILRTENGGNTWAKLLNNEGFLPKIDIEFKPGDPSVVYASTDDFRNKGRVFYKSTDEGKTWRQITSGLPTEGTGRSEIAVSPANPDCVYLLVSDRSSFKGLYKSSDSGENFTLVSKSPNILGYSINGSDDGGMAWYAMAIAVSPTNINEVYVGGINIWKSLDGGTTWEINAYWVYNEKTVPYVHADIHDLVFFGNKLYAGSDGGISYTTNGGSTWTDISKGLGITQFYKMGGYPDDENLVMAGAQDNGANKYNGTEWVHTYGADGMEQLIDYNNPNILYSSYQNGGILKSTDGGNTYTFISSGIGGTGNWVTPLAMDPKDPEIIYLGYYSLWRSADGGNYWYPITNYLSSSQLQSISIAPSNNSNIYVIDDWKILKTKNFGSTWNNISSSYARQICIHPTDPNKIWLFSPPSGIYYSPDEGNSWVNVTGSLPSLPLNSIVYENGSDGGIYAAFDVGVYYRNNKMNDWVPFMTGLPNVIINELEINYRSGKIRAATFGRGIWESGLFSDGTITEYADFNADRFNICIGNTVTFTDKSKGSFNTYSWNFGEGATPNTANTKGPHVVTYTSAGGKTVTLTVNGNKTETKTNYIAADTTLNIVVTPSKIGIATGIPIKLTASGADSYTWSPAEGINTTTGLSVIASPNRNTTYTVTGKQGNCIDKKNVTVKIGNYLPAIDFTLTDIDGKTHKLFDYLNSGKIVVLDFYGVNCGPCQQNTSAVEKVWKAHGPDGDNTIVMLGICCSNSEEEEIKNYCKTYKCTNPQIKGADDVMYFYSANVWPTYLVICPDVLYSKVEGWSQTIEDNLNKAIAACSNTSISSEKDILSYSFTVQTCPVNINKETHTVNIEVKYGTDVSSLVSTFILSQGALATIKGTAQVSGETANSFTNPVTYTITAEDGSIQDWTVSVNFQNPTFDILLTDTNENNITGSTITVNGTIADKLLESHVYIKNSSGSNFSIKVKKEEINTIAGSQNTFCWGYCFAFSVYESLNALVIAAGDINKTDFIGDYYPNEHAGQSEIKYTFFDANKPDSLVSVNTIYKINNSTGINNIDNPGISLNVHPNPFNKTVTVSFTMNKPESVKLQVYNIHGKLVCTEINKKMNSGTHSLLIDGSNWASGMYNLILTVGNNIYTKKIVLHKY